MFVQDCPDGEKCVPLASTEGGGWDTYTCVLVVGDGAPGEPCTYGSPTRPTDDCDETSGCWDLAEVDGQLVGTCSSFRAGDLDFPVCTDVFGCLSASCSVNGQGWSPYYCIPVGCDPMAQDCNEGAGCYWGFMGLDEFRCRWAPDPPNDGPCVEANDCDPGMACVDASWLELCAGESCCTSFCDPNDDFDACPQQHPGTACLPFEPAASLTECGVGACRVP